MSKSSARSVIRLRGVRHNNLKNFDLDLPLKQLIVITGLSGSGKSSLAFDTLFAEGQRRYIETFSPYARQFFDRMDKPQVDSIEGIPPAIAIEQRNAVKTTRSTVGTMTEICDYMKVLWPHLAQLHCRQCGQPVRKDSPRDIWATLHSNHQQSENGSTRHPPEVLITFNLPLSQKLSVSETLALVARQGYQRLLHQGRIVRLDEAASEFPVQNGQTEITVIQDRVKVAAANRARFVEACEQAYHFGKGKLAIHKLDPADPMSAAGVPALFSNRFHCAQCDIEYREPSPALFSFNHPVGACPACKGFGRIISIDYDLALPDRSKTLAEGVVKPWQTGHGLDSQRDLMRMCRQLAIPTNVPFEKLPQKWQDYVIQGEPDYGQDEEHEWPRAWYGVKGYFRSLESKAYKMHVRVLLSRYRAYTPCPDCGGARFQPDSLLYLVTDSSGSGSKGRRTLADFYTLPIRDALRFVEQAGPKTGSAGSSSTKGAARKAEHDPRALALSEVRSRLAFLNDVGLGYLTLDRATRSLSGGETERVNLTTCLGTRLVNTLFVLDEPSVGLHPRDTERLVRILQQLRDAGNTVVVVEHEASVMRAADQIIDLGPGHGAAGGQVVFQGSHAAILEAPDSLTGQYLSGRAEIPIPERRPVHLPARDKSFLANGDAYASEGLALNEALVPYHAAEAATSALQIEGASRHNLENVSVAIPLGRFVCITGVSGSGKTTLVREVLLPGLEAALRSLDAERKLREAEVSAGLDARTNDETRGDEMEAAGGARGTGHLSGFESLGRVVLVDQSILGKTPRSNPAVYVGAFDYIREVFAQSELARQRGLNASAFSFNSAQGQCERCRGAGFEKIEMQFLSDVFIRCPDCNGRRYRNHILDVRIAPDDRKSATQPPRSEAGSRALSIGDLLDATVDDAIGFLSGFTDVRSAERAADSLKLLQEVGLGYLRLGQPINTLSGGESQRLKLVRHLAEAGATIDLRRTLFLFDEPTTGLHFDDVRVLLKVFQRLVDAGHSVLVIEHNLDVIKSADWIIDLGPGAGDEGGRVVAVGTPEEVAGHDGSPTGHFLRELLKERAGRGKSCPPIAAVQHRRRTLRRNIKLETRR